MSPAGPGHPLHHQQTLTPTTAGTQSHRGWGASRTFGKYNSSRKIFNPGTHNVKFVYFKFFFEDESRTGVEARRGGGLLGFMDGWKKFNDRTCHGEHIEYSPLQKALAATTAGSQSHCIPIISLPLTSEKIAQPTKRPNLAAIDYSV